MEVKNWSTEWGGRTLTIETGRYVPQAHGSCTVRYGDTVILATVIKSKNVREGIDYFPLMVGFEEKLYAAGKIKGSRFMKREGRPTDESILTSRMIDRAVRPLFDERVRNDIQIVVTALSIDGENDPAVVGLIAASIAIAISPIAWNGPLAGSRIGLDENGEFKLNIGHEEIKNGKLDVMVAGTPEKLVMVEAGASEVDEDTMFKAMKWGSEQLTPVLELIKKIQSEVGKEKEAVPALADDLDSVGDNKEEEVRQLCEKFVADSAEGMIFNSPKITKLERTEMVSTIKEKLVEFLNGKEYTEDEQKAGLKNIKLYVSNEISKRILEKEQRLDGRKMTDIRDLHSEIDLLPRVHGSGMFMRGDTHVLSIVTLGAPGDVQTLDTMEDDSTKRYMHHYNDGPYTYGETGFMRGPGRRAIGHGALAERALECVLPAEEDFPYAIRVVSEVFSSNGSSSMASTCGSSLSLMAAGVPLKKPVAGMAMGLSSRSDENGNITEWKVLTDLQDVEDGPGGMDFKITGTIDGITAMQMDTKTHGITWDIVEQTLKQSKEARAEILDVMKGAIAEPKAELSEYAPRIETIKIDPEKIGDIIGPGGKTIKKITEETGATIDIEQDGRVMITTNDGEAMEKARKIIEELTREIEAGEIFDGKVVRIEDFGAFINLIPGKDGLVHVSEISYERVDKPGDVLKLGDTVKVIVKEIDSMGRVNLSMKSLLEKPEGFVDRPPQDRGPRGGGGGHRGGPRGGGGNRGGNDRRNSGPQSPKTSSYNEMMDKKAKAASPAVPPRPELKKDDAPKKKFSLFGKSK
ncbi:MAG: polyribonucleotide nucleotidyltransferase [Candidatus Magasanikbacteria bacterium]|jgi:polyribonucleotide nucleotidyltransferase|nr:polyribonucleotide nucleotidyltransferase [Candidatus Magasanikbacteria bacterium]MBT4315027.1 polyribonucleotide nucleotidyltransferase [Candidatus Magasanikbacteria bacterium]MBT4546806.1 polyribonucleotide nucleotidyltransferase [Candidatus Magasanikbacteria bacterium]MBT6818971.1 polyribonucleotide nucleotidyltransferase [Candidatus Magasanikbacteria bacterium]